MKAPTQSLAQTCATVFLLLAPFSGHCFYNPNTGRWLSRDPVQERGGENLYGCFHNNPNGKFDALGLDVTTIPGIPHVSNDRHNNYLIFHISCPSGFKVTNVTPEYDAPTMWDEMFEWYASTYPDPYPEGIYVPRVQSALNDTFGGLANDPVPNCLGNSVEVDAYMRTRLVAPADEFVVWRAAFYTPDPATMIGIYQENTVIRWVCDQCCSRGH